MFRTNTVLAAAILAASAAHAAVVIPQPPSLVGGGATLPAIAYVGAAWLDGTPTDANPSRLSKTDPNVLGGTVNKTPADADSIFGVYAVGTTKSTLFGAGKSVKTPNPNVSYCQTGSGTGRKVIYGNSSNNATGTCGDYLTSPSGFGAPYDAQFGASDAPFLASDYNAFLTNRTANTTNKNNKSGPVQFPVLAGAIAVVYNAPASAGLSAQMNLTESQICKAFSGQYATWGDLLGSSDTTPITIVYRDDDSGTTFNFTNHLSSVCPTAIDGSVSSVFSVNSNFGKLNQNNAAQATFANANFLGTPTYNSADKSVSAVIQNGSGSPITAMGENGNGAVVGTVLATPGAIGYAEVADATYRAAAAGGSALAVASVSIQSNKPTTYYCFLTPSSTSTTKLTCSGKGNKLVTVKAKTFKTWDPVTGFAKSVKVNFTSDKVLVSSGGTALESLATAAPAATVAEAGCMQIVDPATIATPALKKGEYTNYPIMAVTYLLGFNTGNTVISADQSSTTDVHDFVASLMAAPYSTKAKKVGAKTGYAILAPVLDSAAAGGAKKAATLVANCVKS
jgi:ABC-type phosphate transport system substrate-binding protein